MRVLSFIPAFILAAASFVAAAPTDSMDPNGGAIAAPTVPTGQGPVAASTVPPTPDTNTDPTGNGPIAAPTVPPTTSTDPSCAPGYGAGGDNDAPLQGYIGILNNATTYLGPLHDQLDGCKSAPDVNLVVEIVGKIDAIVAYVIVQLEAQAKVDLTGLTVVNLCVAINACLTLVLGILEILVAIVIALGAKAVGTLQGVICDLLGNVIVFVGCLKVFVVANITDVLGPIIALVLGIVDCLLVIVKGLNVLVVATGH